MESLLAPLLCAMVIAFVLLLFILWLYYVKIHNEILDIKHHVGAIPETVQKSTQGIASGITKQAKEKPPLPEDLDALTDVLIKMLKADWVCTSDASVGLTFYQIAQYVAPYIHGGGWRAEKYYDTNTDHFWVRLSPPEQRQQQKQGGGKQQNQQQQQQGKKQQQPQGR